MRYNVLISYLIAYAAMMKSYAYSEGKPWPPIKRKVAIQKCEYSQPVIETAYYRRTGRSTIHPIRNKGWKGKR